MKLAENSINNFINQHVTLNKMPISFQERKLELMDYFVNKWTRKRLMAGIYVIRIRAMRRMIRNGTDALYNVVIGFLKR